MNIWHQKNTRLIKACIILNTFHFLQKFHRARHPLRTMAIVYNSLPPFRGGPPDFWSSLVQFPTKIMDQNFGQELKPADLKDPFVPGVYTLPRTRECIDETGFSRVFFEPECFQIQFKTDQFKIEDLFVHFNRDSVVISGESGFVKEGEGETFRKFERKYLLPVDAKMGDESCVSKNDGVVTVRIPRVAKKVQAKTTSN